MYLIVNCPQELKNYTKIEVGQVFLELLILNVLIHNLKIAWPTKLFMRLLSFLDDLLKDAYIIKKKIETVDNFEIANKTY